MLPKQSLNYPQYKFTLLITTVMGLVLILVSIIKKKEDFFLMLNLDLGKQADAFFKYFTNLGDGLFWLFWALLIIIKKGKKYFPLLLSAVLFSTLLTQISKQVIYPDEQRPLQAIADQSMVHYVTGVTIHSINSFPSGHTATVFSFLLLLALFTETKVLLFLGFVAALLVAYSRIYLGQHFPLDVGAGMLVAVCTMILSVKVQERFEKKTFKNENMQAKH